MFLAPGLHHKGIVDGHADDLVNASRFDFRCHGHISYTNHDRKRIKTIAIANALTVQYMYTVTVCHSVVSVRLEDLFWPN